jgi:hypothetical protein
MPALRRVHLKTSNTHNFWSVAPKIMKFALTRSLFQDASSKKVSKNLKIVWDHTIQPKIGLSPVGTSGPLGVNYVQKLLFYNIIFNIKFKINFYFKDLLPTFCFYPHLMASTYTSWYQFPPIGIKPKTSSFPRISLNSPLTHEVSNHKPTCTWEFLKYQYTISAVFDTSK